ncbi:glycosyltransferase family 2 protein [uncultured Desulfobulbus sp.]|uniref:glycosyltransferase family 2 protein n=1 Tax=uncultured Desulfobulbus sp. TaxID=239745 RepID=UPI0029C6D66A|nr:glycosyltransferase family 2 protein [uncultured Desulfobulbus sp.]
MYKLHAHYYIFMKIIFWSSLFFILYTYLGYPFWLAFRKKCFLSRNNFEVDTCELHDIAVVIAVYNEEKNISKRVVDINRQNYPQEKLKIIVVTDGSTDRTMDELSKLSFSNLEIISLPENQGKSMALNVGVAAARSELVIFTDARQAFAPNAIRNLNDTFADPNVGCVSGELVFLQDTESAIREEMGVYWKYEKWIRKTESITGSVVGATGAIYAIRRKLYRTLPQGALLDDVLTPMNIVMQGYRSLLNSESIAYDNFSRDVAQEWKRKVRTLAGNWQLLSIAPSLLLPWQNPLWWRFLSHKIFRLLVPLGLSLFLVASVLAEGFFFEVAMLLQLVVYTVALLAWLIPTTRKYKVVKLIYFFVLMNIAVTIGFWKWATGQCHTVWQPAHKNKQEV